MGLVTKRRALALLLVCALVAGIASVAVMRFRSPAEDHAIGLVPADATAYLHGFVKPSTEQRKALRDLLALFPAAAEEDEAERLANEFLARVLANLGLTFDDDVPDWLGDEIAAFTVDGSTAILLAVDDEERALSAIREASPPDHTLRAVDGFVVVGDELAVSAAGESRSLADDARYREYEREFPEHRILTFFGREPSLAERAFSLPSITARLFEGGSVGVAVHVTEDSAVVDLVAPGRVERNEGIASFPPDLTFALALQEGGREIDILRVLLPDVSPSSVIASARLGIARVDADVEFVMPDEASAKRAMAGLANFAEVQLRQDVQSENASFRFDPGFPLPEVEASRQARTIRLRAGERGASRDERGNLGSDPTLESRLGSATPLLHLDLGAVPGPLRSFALRQASLPSIWETAAAQTVSVDLGVRPGPQLEVYRLVAVFGPA